MVATRKHSAASSASNKYGIDRLTDSKPSVETQSRWQAAALRHTRRHTASRAHRLSRERALVQRRQAGERHTIPGEESKKRQRKQCLAPVEAGARQSDRDGLRATKFQSRQQSK